MRHRGQYCFLLSITAVILLLLFAAGLVTNELIDVYAKTEMFENRVCIIVDAGHGGVDGGAVSCTGIPESQINLEIALRLNDLLQLLGIHTKMIRTEDISIYTKGESIAAKKVSDLKERVRIVNSTSNAILLSIHQNYFTDSKYSGAQVFYSGTDTNLASLLQTNLIQILNVSSKRRAKRAEGVYLMNNIRCPAALIECGFLSNPHEEQLLRTVDYQKKLCCIISATVSCYIQNLTTA